MKKRSSFGATAASLGLALLISGCGEDNPIRWKEDVLLSNGQVITLDRYQEFKGSRAIGQRPSPSDYWFDLDDPVTKKKVRFNGNGRSTTEALMTSNGTLYLLAGLVGGAWLSSALDCPDPGFLLWELRDGVWQRIPFEQIPQRVIKANMSPNGFQFKNNDQLARYDGHVPVRVTQDRQTQSPDRPLIYDFSKVEKQTTGQENCNSGRGDDPRPYYKK